MHEFKRRFPPPPSDWSRPRLADIAERVTTRNVERNPNVLTISAELGLISQGEFFSRRVASESLAGYFLLEGGDFAYNKSYSRGYPLGAIRRLDRYPKGCVSPLYICFRPRANAVDSDFLLHYLDGGAIDAGLADVAKEGVRNHGLLNVGVADFFSLEVPLPPVTEQRVVARILDTLDTTIRQTEAIIEKLKQVKQGLLNDLLTRGIDANGELRPPQSQAPHLYKNSPLGWIPREWRCDSLDEVVRIVDCKHITPTYVAQGYPVVRPRNVKVDGLDLVNVEFVTASDFAAMTDVHAPRSGDIVLSRNASFGVPAFVDTDRQFAIGQDVIVMTQTWSNTRFLFYCLQSSLLAKQIDQRSAGSTFGRINLSDIRALIVPTPDSSEQTAIAAGLTSFDTRIQREDRGLAKLRTMKSGLVDDLLTGRVRVTPLLS